MCRSEVGAPVGAAVGAVESSSGAELEVVVVAVVGLGQVVAQGLQAVGPVAVVGPGGGQETLQVSHGACDFRPLSMHSIPCTCYFVPDAEQLEDAALQLGGHGGVQVPRVLARPVRVLADVWRHKERGKKHEIKRP